MNIGETGELLRRSTVHILGSGSGFQSQGSGVIWSSDGLIITNAHVIRSGARSVQLWDGRSFVAEVADRDDRRDLARLRIPAAGLTVAKVRTTPVSQGETVIAAGNPLGFTGAISTGVARGSGTIRGFGRGVWVQAEVRLAPGNSGGPLADGEGSVIGINTMVVRGGMALAIPSSTVEEFLRSGSAPRIGVTIQAVRLPGNRLGLLVLSVEPGSPAEQASLMLGDVLTGFGEGSLGAGSFKDPEDLSEAIARAASGRLRLRFLRGERTHEREVTIAFGERRRAAA